MSVTKTIILRGYQPGATGLTCSVLSYDGTSSIQLGLSLTESAVNSGIYESSLTAAINASLTTYSVNVYRSSAWIGGGLIDIKESAGTYEIESAPTSLQISIAVGSSDSPGVTTLLARVTASVGSPMQAGASVALAASQPNYAPARASDLLVTPANKLVTNSDGSVNASVTGATINNYVTVPAAVAQSSLLYGVLTIIRGDTYRQSLPLMGTISGRSKLVVTAKVSVNDPDSAAIFQVVEGVGLAILNGSSSVTAGQASLTVANETTGASDLVIHGPTTALLGAQSLVWDAQFITSGEPYTPIGGTCNVVADVTQAVA
jgi:hypothetical protein